MRDSPETFFSPVPSPSNTDSSKIGSSDIASFRKEEFRICFFCRFRSSLCPSDSLSFFFSRSKTKSCFISGGLPRLLWLISFTEPSARFSSVRPSLVILLTTFSLPFSSFPAKTSASFLFSLFHFFRLCCHQRI